MGDKGKLVQTPKEKEKVEVERLITQHEKEEEKSEIVEPWEHVRSSLQEACSLYASAYNQKDAVKKIDFHIEQDLYRLEKPENVGNATIVAKGVVRLIMSIHHKILDTTKTAIISNSVFGFQSEVEADTAEWKVKCYTGVFKDLIGYSHMVADSKMRVEDGKKKSNIIKLGKA